MTKKDEIRFTAGDIPSILKKGFKPMTDSNIQPPQNTLESDFVDIKDPVPGTEVTQTPGLIPEMPTAVPGYDPNTATAPGEYVPPTDEWTGQDEWVENDGTHGTMAQPPYTTGEPHVDPSYAEAFPPVYEGSDDAHKQLLENPNYAVHVHENQINRIIEVLEQISDQINHLECRIGDLEHAVRFDAPDDHDGPPTPPTDYEDGSTT
jgi:hypothetical protein